MTKRNTIMYFRGHTDYEQAEAVRQSLTDRYPGVRLVWYLKGIAVQYYRSGPYYPELEADHDSTH